MSKSRYTSAELDARLKFALGIMLGVILLSTTLGILYALIFVTQPVNAQSENDKMFFNVLGSVATFITGTLAGLLIGKSGAQEMKEAMENTTVTATIEEAVEEVVEGISDVKNFFLKVADDIKKGFGSACVAEYNDAIKAGKSNREAIAIYDACLSGEKGGFQGPSVTKATSGIAEKKDEIEETKKDLEEAISTIKTLQTELNEVNLLNAKLLYTNKIFKAKSLNEAQKVKVLKAFDKATNVSEVKTVYNTLSESFETKTKTTIKESVGFASKAVGVAPAQPIVEGDAAIRRMQQLAGIVK